MPNVSMSVDLGVPAKQVWDLIGGFNALPNWHPAVAKSEITEDGNATLRTLHLAGGGTIVERLEKLDDSGQHYTYSIVSGPLPVANYTSTLRLKESADGKSCTVEWGSSFDAAGASDNDAMSAIQGVYQAGFDNLKKMFGV